LKLAASICHGCVGRRRRRIGFGCCSRLELLLGPSVARFPEELRASPRTLEAYGRGRRLLGQEYVADGKFELAVEKFFNQEQIDYIQVHGTTAGCFTFRIDRTDRPLTPVPEN
jgi:hypothetical protein